MEVWLDKRGEVPDRPPTDAQWWGSALEDVIGQRYERETRTRVWNPEQLYRHPDHDCLIATPDRIVANNDKQRAAGLEIKTAGIHAAHEWGEPGTDQIPHHYLLQCAHYMAVTGIDRWDVAVLIGGSDFRIYTLHRDAELEQQVISRLVDWWRTHMQEGVEPDMDGSAGVRDWLHRRFPRETDAAPLVADEATEALATRLALARTTQDAADAEREVMENSIKAVMGDHARIEGRGWSVSWKATKPRITTDWKAVAEAYRNILEMLAGIGGPDERKAAGRECDKAVQRHTTEAAAVRRFVFNVTTARREQ